MNHSAWMVRSEGSPAGTILFSVVGTIGLSLIIAGGASAIAGSMVLGLGRGWSGAFQALGSLGGAIVLAVGIAWVFTTRHVEAPTQKVEAPPPSRDLLPGMGKAALAELRSGLAPDLLMKREVADRAAYEGCVLWLAETRPPAAQLLTCADGLVQAWDESVAAKRHFARMPEDGGGFPAKIGAMYVAYAEAADDAPAGIAGVAAVEERSRARYPTDQATLEDLRIQRESLKRRR